MTLGEIRQKLWQKTRDRLSPRCNIRRLAFALDKFSIRNDPGIYVERAEYGPSNLEVKLKRERAGGPFEPYDVILVNRLAVALADALRPGTVLEVGSGTGIFASGLAEKRPSCDITASEFEDATRQWAVSNRPAPTIHYCKKPLDHFGHNQFDLAVALEVIEHIADYATFLRAISRVAPVVILSTPNKLRGPFESIANPAGFDQHVREWSAGEFFWVLRVFWDEVKLHTIPNMCRQMQRVEKDPAYQPQTEETGLHCREHSLVAVCSAPRCMAAL